MRRPRPDLLAGPHDFHDRHGGSDLRSGRPSNLHRIPAQHHQDVARHRRGRKEGRKRLPLHGQDRRGHPDPGQHRQEVLQGLYGRHQDLQSLLSGSRQGLDLHQSSGTVDVRQFFHRRITGVLFGHGHLRRSADHSFRVPYRALVQSKDSWRENGNRTWTRTEQWTYTPEGSSGDHAWIYTASTSSGGDAS